ncbi:MAG: VWA domain-containing protein [Bryobacterales bacterium]|nr:VWA domain-containing protein [Bryobacterales bacterium]
MMVLLVAAMLMFLVPVIGLVVDCSLIYYIRARLTAAADAAALAAARSLNLGITVADQNANAVARARAFFDANYSGPQYGAKNTNLNVTLAQGTTPATQKTLYVTTQAQTDAPTYFMNIFNISKVTIRVDGQAARRNINLMLVLDRSGSMTNTQPGSMSTACDTMKSAAKNFVTYFANNRDRLALVTYETSYYLTFAANSNFNPGISTAIDGISCSGGTNISSGLNQAYSQLQQIGEPAALNVIVLFTDGQPTALTCDFPVKLKRDSRYGDGNSSASPTALYPSGSSMTSTVTFPPSPCKDPSGDQWYKGPSYTNPAGPYNPNWQPFPVGSTGAGASNYTIRGAIVYAGSTPDPTGYVYGLYNWSGSPTPISTPGGCAFQQSAWSNRVNAVRRDIAYIPDTDAWGNSTTGFRTNWVFPSPTNFTGRDKFTSNSESSYNGHIRPDNPASVGNAAYNVTDNQGSRIRADGNLNPIIYTIGLGGNDSSGYGVDTELLIRLANVQNALDPNTASVINNSIYNAAQPQGLYVYAPNTVQLNQAFALIASSVLRLSR